MVAVDNNRVDAVKFLIKNLADVNIVSRQINHSAISYACRRNNAVMINILKAAGTIHHKTGTSDCP